MVTTNSVHEIQALFAQILEKVRSLVSELDESEGELRYSALTLYSECVAAVLPVLKYVDKDVQCDNFDFRGVALDDEWYLSRDGKMYHKESSTPVEYADYRKYDYEIGVDELVDQLIQWITNLGKIFHEALTRMDERRQSLAGRNEKLQEAAAVFQRDDS